MSHCFSARMERGKQPCRSRYEVAMQKTKPSSHALAWFFPRFERRYEPLATRALFARRLAVNVVTAAFLILISLIAGMAGYHYLDHVPWIDAFDQTAMIVGGMGPYSEPKTFDGKLFAGVFALYSGVLLIGLTVFILTPLFHRVMHSFHLPGGEDEDATHSRRTLPKHR
jgi:hypothetical protein